ncbi:MAG: C40 family peptidase [Prevotellaceae bacterium]|nr:C40 family peptidase [Prevotellaceae bacterium]
MLRKDIIISLFVCVIIFGSCFRTEPIAELDRIGMIIDSVGAKYAPDKRDAVYEISIEKRENTILVDGFTSIAEARDELAERLQAFAPTAVGNIVLLPDESIGDKSFGIINVSVADARTGNDYDAEMATQLLLGSSVELLQRDNWYRIRTSEGYLAWLDCGLVVPVNSDEWKRWTEAKKVIFTDDYGFAYSAPRTDRRRVSDLVFGNVLRIDGEVGSFYRVLYPDGRQAYILKTQCLPYECWIASMEISGESIVREAMALKGIPYMWGGTSVKGMDCSGFVKTVYLRHGLRLRRDASQQARTGAPVDISDGLKNLGAGDLLFFGRKATEDQAEKIRHVAIYTGDGDFIHASGYIRENSLIASRDNYDSINANELVCARRILGYLATDGIESLADKTIY